MPGRAIAGDLRPAAPTSGARPVGTVRVDCRTGLDLDAAERASVDALLDDRPSVGVFASRAWLSGFFEDPPDDVEPAMLLLRDDAAIRGCVPIGVRRARTHARVTLLGGGLGSDRIDLLGARGTEPACADAFLVWLGDTFGRAGFVLELRDVPAESAIWGALHRAGAERRVRVTLALQDIQPLPYLDLADAGVDPDTAGDEGSLDKHQRWLARRGDIRADLLSDRRDALAGFDTLVRFLQDRWAGHGGSTLDDPRRQRFHRRAIPGLLAEGRLRMIRLSAGGRAVAIYYGLAAGDWWGYYLAGYDRTWAGRIRLGHITLSTAIAHARRDGAAEFDFLKGAERIKYRWPVRERTTIDAEVATDRPGAQWTRVVHAARDAAGACATVARGLRARWGARP